MKEPTLAEADAEFEMQHTERATAMYESIVSAHPESALAHQGLAACHFAGRRWEKASEEALIALGLDNQLVLPHRVLANCYLRQKNLDLYARELSSIVDKDAGAWKVQLALGSLLARMGRKEEGLASFQRAADTAPGEWLPYYHLAGVYIQLGDRDRAYTAVKAAFQRRKSILTLFLFVGLFMSLNRLWMLPATALTFLASLILPFPSLVPFALVIGVLLIWSAMSYGMLKDWRKTGLAVVTLVIYLGLLLLVRA